LEAFLTQNAMEGTSLYVTADAPPVSGQALEELVNQYQRVEETIARMARTYPQNLLEAMLKVAPLAGEGLRDRAQVEDWVAKMSEQLNVDTKTGMSYVYSIVEDQERSQFLPRVQQFVHGIANAYVLTREFFDSSGYRAIARVSQSLNGLLEDDAYLLRGEKRVPITDFKQALDFLMKEAQRGLMIQRYKGLGEMNPEQLWETTMDPASRRMMKVTIEDAIGADQIFTTLMGDEVEPRRAFIQSNALEVSNLDV
jgi:DNA gyrase subunit B